ncbi:hypothetical protein [Halorussus sp. MSC15.2]|uniref:hypothetical protein n=1 Tax=Halorussus sp. MSC15.2 TaxID=2283638 RepID=UPI0013D80318|nr:hypothetical protein [Halorussus sp. MSC15.2]NEU58597.1 hypothetical protein [Halorussus sp. MSC15.2]
MTTNAINRESYVWQDKGTPPAKGDEIYVAGDQPVAAYDNWAMWAVTTDIKRLDARLADHAHFHEAGAEDPIDLDGLSIGKKSSETIAETSSPASFTFSGSEKRDLHVKTVVTLSNASGSSTTEDVTVALYDGTDATGSLIASQTKSVTIADGSSSTVTFLHQNEKLDDGDHYVEITTSGTALSVDQTVEHVLSCQYVFQKSATGDLQFTDHHGTVYAERDGASGYWTTFTGFDTNVDFLFNSLEKVGDVNADNVRGRNEELGIRTKGSGTAQVTLYDENGGQDIARAREGGEFEVPNGPLSVGADVRTTGGTTVWDAANGYVPQGSLENDALSVSYGSHLSGDGSVALGGTLNLSVDDDFVQNSGDTMAGTLDMGGNDLADGGTTVWDAANGYVPESSLQTLSNAALSNSAISTSFGRHLSGDGSVALGGTLNLSVDDDFVQNSGDAMTGNLDMGSNATQYGDFEVRENSTTNALEFNYTA